MDFFNFEYDTLPHLFTSFIIALIIFNYLKKEHKLSNKELFIFTLLITLGIAAIHEIIEYIGYKFLGKGQGMFFFGPGDFGNSPVYENTMTDLINNLMGALIACILSTSKILQKLYK